MARRRSIYHDPTEESPLLSPMVDDEDTLSEESNPLSRLWQSPATFVLWLLGTILLLSLGDQWAENPQLRIFESVICYRYYEKVDPSKIIVGRDAVGPGAIGGVDEMLCKVDAVQGDVAMLRGWQQLFDAFPSLLLAIPIGYAADRFGRRPFVLAGLISYVLRMGCMQFVFVLQLQSDRHEC